MPNVENFSATIHLIHAFIISMKLQARVVKVDGLEGLIDVRADECTPDMHFTEAGFDGSERLADRCDVSE
jgi:hypothetical protein